MADGGEGTVDAVIDALDGQRVVVDVADALGRPISATYWLRSATAAGRDRDRRSRRNRTHCTDERDALGASTFGVGQLISSALDQGATDVLIGLGGSATNDGAPACSPRSGSSSSMPAETASLREAVRSNVCTESTCPKSTHGCATPAFAWPAMSPRLCSAPPGQAPSSDPERAPRPPTSHDLESALTQLA